jgi:sulfate adenylyltransferase
MPTREITQELIRPHGGLLVDLYLPPDETELERAKARDLQSWDLTPRQLCDIELLLNGAFSPLTGFLTQADYDRVVESMRLGDGTLWPMPVTLDVSEAFAETLSAGQEIALRDQEGVLIATLSVEDVWTPDKALEARGVFGTEDATHPGVHYLMHQAHPVYVGGSLRGVESPIHYDFRHLRDTPAELRTRFAKLGWRKIVAFQTRNPMHRAHQELTICSDTIRNRLRP